MGFAPFRFHGTPLARVAVAVLLVAVLVSGILGTAGAGASEPTVGALPLAAALEQPDFTSLSPERLADTRAGRSTIDGQFRGGGLVSPTKPLVLTVGGRGGVPASGVAAVALNVTVTGPKGPGYLTAYPNGEARPTASNINYTAGRTVANAIVAKLGTGNRVVLHSSAPAHVIVDVSGYFSAGGVHALSPARLADTRSGRTTADGGFAGTGAVSPSSRLDLQVTGRGGVPGSGVTAVALNVTATGPTGEGYLTVHPAGSARPAASNLNFLAGQTVANSVVAKVGTGGTTDGKVSIHNSNKTVHVIVDVAGYFTADSDYVALNPARFADTRANGSAVAGPSHAAQWPFFLIDRASAGVGPIGAATFNGDQIDVLVSGRGGVPVADTGAVVLNVTVTQPSAGGHLTVFPLDSPMPTASSVNFPANRTVPNLVIAKVGRGGGVSIFSSVPASHIVVDVLGYFPGVSTADVPGEYAALGRDGLDMPITYDRCYSLPYSINPANAQPGWIADVRTAVGLLEDATGIDFVELPFTTEAPTYPRMDADRVLVAFTTPGTIPELGGDVVGIGGSVIGALADEVRMIPTQFFHGFAYFDITDGLQAGFGTGLSFGQVALHELAHVVGLGHILNEEEIMNVSVIERAGSYGTGDLTGLGLLYRTQGCPGSPATFGALRTTLGKEAPAGAELHMVSSVHDSSGESH